MTPAHTHANDAIDAATERCAAAGETLTPVRRRVLELLLARHEPAKAYDLLDELRLDHAAAKPPTIYRALEFLVRMGLAHRVESLNAFVACGHGHHDGGAAVLLLCDRCGAAEEAEDGALGAAVHSLGARQGFEVARTVIEAHGVCAACRASS